MATFDHEVKVIVTLQVSQCDPYIELDQEFIQRAALASVRNAVRFADNNGFSHPWTEDVSVGLVSCDLQ